MIVWFSCAFNGCLSYLYVQELPCALCTRMQPVCRDGRGVHEKRIALGLSNKHQGVLTALHLRLLHLCVEL